MFYNQFRFFTIFTSVLMSLLLLFTKVHAAQLTVVFQDTAPNECGFKVERKADDEASPTVFWIDVNTATGGVSHVDNGLREGVRYCYTVWAFNSLGLSDPAIPLSSGSDCAIAIRPDVTSAPTDLPPTPVAPCMSTVVQP